MKPINVAAGILIDGLGRVLITERLGDSPFSGLWEFPGGKITKGESPADALRRELMEELGVVVKRQDYFMNVEHRYADKQVVLDFFLVSEWSGKPFGREGQALRWESMDSLDAAMLLPADAPIVEALKNRG